MIAHLVRADATFVVGSQNLVEPEFLANLDGLAQPEGRGELVRREGRRPRNPRLLRVGSSELLMPATPWR